MIKRLRLRLISVTLLAVLGILGGIMTIINIVNFSRCEKEGSENLIALVTGNYYDEVTEIDDVPKNEEGLPIRRPENFIENSFFVTQFDAEGQIVETNYKRFFSLNQEDCETFAKSVYEGDVKEGKHGNLRYLKEVTDGKTIVAVIDLKENIDSCKKFLISSIIISSFGFALSGALIVFGCFRVTKTSEESYKKQEAFITNASHELKTPLTIISTDVEIIEMDSGKSEWSDSIKDQVKRLTTLTNQLVELSEFKENKSKEYPNVEFDLSECANKVANEFTQNFLKAELDFNVNIKENIKVIKCEYLIEQVLYIFLDNATKYAKKGSKVDFIVRNLKNKTEFYVENELNDNTNIDTNSIFDRFYRGANEKTKGSGIGLSIVKDIAEIQKAHTKAVIKDNRIRISFTF